MVLALIQACANAIKSSRKAGPAGRTCLTFLLSGNLFAVDTIHLKEIVRCGILAVPRDKPQFLRGFFRHAGRMLPIVDLARRYSDHLTEVGGRTCIVIVDMGQGVEVGILVDEVRGLIEFDKTTLKPLPDMFRRMLTFEIVDGLLQSPRDMLIVLGIQRLLAADEVKELRYYCEQMNAS